ncbi:hypothetical protein KY366_06390 [Candidatus Woesearchaeota archaeon]|nr:hypothetical protein [Candidatus Woesearchaeota archaeon]
MKIAVCGSGLGKSNEIIEKAKEIGKEIAKSHNIVLTGGGTGYPYAAARGAILENGKAVFYSPARSIEEHRTYYGFPLEENAQYVFTGKGIPGRNLPLVKDADAVIIIGGQIGTLNEFTLAFHYNKKIGILENSGKLMELIPKIAAVCDKKGESRKIIYSKDARELVEKVLN